MNSVITKSDTTNYPVITKCILVRLLHYYIKANYFGSKETPLITK